MLCPEFIISNYIRCHEVFLHVFLKICFDRSYFPISFAFVLIARGKNHCIIKHHEGKSLLTENTGSQNNHSSWLFGQSWWDADSPKIVQNAVFSVQNTVYGIHTVLYSTHTVYCIHTWIVCTNSFLSPPLKLKLHASNFYYREKLPSKIISSW